MYKKKMKYVQLLLILLLISNKLNNIYCDNDPFYFFFLKKIFFSLPPAIFTRTSIGTLTTGWEMLMVWYGMVYTVQTLTCTKTELTNFGFKIIANFFESFGLRVCVLCRYRYIHLIILCSNKNYFSNICSNNDNR